VSIAAAGCSRALEADAAEIRRQRSPDHPRDCRDTEQPIVTRIELVAVYPPARDGGDAAMVTPLRALPFR
jgi:hypothetical protein